MKHPEIEEEDTGRLATRSDVPPEMLRALSALKAEGPSRRTLEVVSSRLGSLLDAPAPAAQPARWLWRGLGARAVALRVGVAALTIGTAAVWLRPAARQPTESARASRVEAPPEQGAPVLVPGAAVPEALPASAQAAPSEAAPPGDPATESAERRAAEPTASTEVRGGVVSGERTSGRGRSRRSRGTSGGVRTATQRGSASATSAAAIDREAQASSAAAERAEQKEPTVPAHAEVVGPTPDAGVAHPVAEVPEVRLPSEYELMLDARRLAVRDPRAAQRLLQQHATRFPEGVLAPEREVLAIEVLRALGQAAEAEQRLRAFRARYPNSMHLRRLSTSPATPAR